MTDIPFDTDLALQLLDDEVRQYYGVPPEMEKTEFVEKIRASIAQGVKIKTVYAVMTNAGMRTTPRRFSAWLKSKGIGKSMDDEEKENV